MIYTTDQSPVIFSHDIVKDAMFYKSDGFVRRIKVLAYWPEQEIIAVASFDCEGATQGNKIYTEEEVMTYFQKDFKKLQNEQHE